MRAQSTVTQLEAVKVLVALHGQRAAARIAGLNPQTVRSWCQRYDWPKPILKPKRGKTKTHQQVQQIQATLVNAEHPSRIQSPVNVLINHVETCKHESLTNQAAYLAEASAEARAHEAKLKITQEAKHLSEIHRNLFPEQQSERNILNLNVLIGNYKPLDQLPE